MNKINIKDLLINSATYNELHVIKQSDVAKANSYHRRITASRNIAKPMPGDIMICQGPRKEYSSGHIAYENLSHPGSVCVQPHVPFVSAFFCKRNELTFDTSGGYWFTIPEERVSTVRLVGQRNKLFKTWGHCGACANGAFTFSCEVNVWEYYSDDIY